MLIERLTADKQLRRLCGWERPGQVPDASVFSRAFARFARSELPSRVHAALIKRTHQVYIKYTLELNPCHSRTSTKSTGWNVRARPAARRLAPIVRSTLGSIRAGRSTNLKDMA
jgi:hypothetical protein